MTVVGVHMDAGPVQGKSTDTVTLTPMDTTDTSFQGFLHYCYEGDQKKSCKKGGAGCKVWSGFCLACRKQTSVSTSNNQECMAEALLADRNSLSNTYTEFDLADYKRLKVQEANRNVYQSNRRAQKKLDEGLDPTIDRRTAQRVGESDGAYAKRIEKNRAWVEWNRGRKHAIQEGTWKPRQKLTVEGRRRKQAYKVAKWRAAKKQALALQASAE